MITTLGQYQSEALKSRIVTDDPKRARSVAMLGILGEIGSSVTLFKKWRRGDGLCLIYVGKKLSEDLGDILWYVSDIASQNNVSLEALQYESISGASIEIELCYRRIARIVGQLDTAIDDCQKNDIEAAITEMLMLMANLATQLNTNLLEVALSNLAKISEMTVSPDQSKSFDADFPADEQFPPQLEVTFSPSSSGSVDTMVLVDINTGEQVGNTLDDNVKANDGYRFHDILHLAFMVYLGWSPVMRKLLGCKRKSDPEVDRVEDGARAQIVEELVVKLIDAVISTRYGGQLGKGRFDPNVVRDDIMMFVGQLEVSKRSVQEWLKAIHVGCTIWEKLRASNRGTVIADYQRQELLWQSRG